MNLRIAGVVMLVLAVVLAVVLVGWLMLPSESRKRIAIEMPGLPGGFRVEAELWPPEKPGGEELPRTSSSDDQVITENCAGGDLVNVALGKPVAHVPSIVLGLDRPGDQVRWNLRYSVDRGHFPSNLVDGDTDTLAYPASSVVDYVVDLQGSFDIQAVALVWGGYGESRDYITFWKIYAEDYSGFAGDAGSSGVWEPFASGDFPNSAITVINKLVKASRFRIIAVSVDPEIHRLRNWIGIQEFQACA